MDDNDEAFSSDYSDEPVQYWIEWFMSLKGNEFFCEIDEDFISDRFNLTGIPAEVPMYQEAYALMTDTVDEDVNPEPDELREMDTNARHLYGLIHQRFILTARGLIKMYEKMRHAEFGRCPRVLCHNQPVLPVGLSDVPGLRSVMLYCPRCEDVYTPPLRRHAAIDGAYFGTTFPHMLLQAYPQLVPSRSNDRYVPKIFGFKVHSISKEQKRQDEIRESQRQRLADLSNTD
ncbi:casein kinase 2 regulatory subunit [Entophlyctis luteolus]|nr:casein kinase 2 regulatory subunit [Entophlyctis luteolus]KAJ3349904.1 casein kinase 2 regulatory subunit [Entophlyctis luteolus]KAJ3389779.1 casein kinase 2 regulatory subunit [Entophlyctis sp. JEL0112]